MDYSNQPEPRAEHDATSVPADQPAKEHWDRESDGPRPTVTSEKSIGLLAGVEQSAKAEVHEKVNTRKKSTESGCRVIAGGWGTRLDSRVVCQRMDALSDELLSAVVTRLYRVERIFSAVYLARVIMIGATERIRQDRAESEKIKYWNIFLCIWILTVYRFENTDYRRILLITMSNLLRRRYSSYEIHDLLIYWCVFIIELLLVFLEWVSDNETSFIVDNYVQDIDLDRIHRKVNYSSIDGLVCQDH